MPQRTKGFFEQEHGNKSNFTSWNRHANHKTPLNEASINVPFPKPPISPNPHTKDKLQAFHFTEKRTAALSEKENNNAAYQIEADTLIASEIVAAPPVLVSEALPCQDGRTMIESEEHQTKPTPRLTHAFILPGTPGTRLTLEDLIGDPDENSRKDPSVLVPEEHIGWIPNSSSANITPLRRRKRARSSSPSCPNTSSQPPGTLPPLEELVEKTTPEADPVAALWQNYASSKDSAETHPRSGLHELLFQASPRLMETPAKSAGLRRWASTGNEWPSGVKKRRKLEVKPNIEQWRDEQEDDTTKSKVASMIDKLQHSLATQKMDGVADEGEIDSGFPSSSSPLPAACNQPRLPLPVTSPSRAVLTRHVTAKPSTHLPPPRIGLMPRPKQSSLKPPDAHLGITTVQQGDVFVSVDVVAPAPLHLHRNGPLPAFKRPTLKRVASASGRQYPTPSTATQVPPATKIVEIDEFDADAFDLTIEDLTELTCMNTVPESGKDSTRVHTNLVRDDHHAPASDITKDESHLQAPKSPSDDEFGGDDLDDDALAEAESCATQRIKISQTNPLNQPSHASLPVSGIAHAEQPDLRRFRVSRIADGSYTDFRGRVQPEKVLYCEGEHSKLTVVILCRDSWHETPATSGCTVHVVNLPSQEQISTHISQSLEQIIIADSEESPVLIIHPDHMLSATTVADSFDCVRKAVLQDRVKVTGENKKPLVYGKILHEIFQQALTANQWGPEYLQELVDNTVQLHVEGLWELGMRDTVDARNEILAKMSELAAWAGVFVATKPSSTSVIEGKNGESMFLSLSKLIAIEEHIWSPKYGLKGNVDATIQGTTGDGYGTVQARKIMPFEVKTGRTTKAAGHQAQTALYTLLLSDRYKVNIDSGILYYLESSNMMKISPPVREIRQMIQQRNRLAADIAIARHPESHDRVLRDDLLPAAGQLVTFGLPAMLRNPFKCGSCYARATCFTYHALTENGTSQSAGMIDDQRKNHSLIWQETVGHLSSETQDRFHELKTWFAKWDRLLTFEEQEHSRLKKELWTMSSSERERAGRCFGNVVIVDDLSSTASALTSTMVDGIEGSGMKINRYTYAFRRVESKPSQGFADATQLTPGEAVTVSTETGQWALANGYVIGCSKSKITVAVDRRLGDARRRLAGFDADSNQAFKGVMTVGEDGNGDYEDAEREVYRIDKDEFSNGLALVRRNLATMTSDHPIHTRLRDLIIHNSPPKSSQTLRATSLGPSQIGEMNDDQMNAVNQVLSAQDYALILGMPGTGKTTTIAHIIRALIADNKSILLTSFTHTAVDNILIKIRDIVPTGSILRLGVPSKINPEVQKFCRLAATPRNSIDEVEAAFVGCQIVATTCMGTNHALFNRRSFDICIVDEASQITLPTSLGPLLHARKFVLVGDHYQLPPLVQNRNALEGGLDISLFKQLSERHAESIAVLGRQYRMCEEIMTLSNTLIYGGRLCCGEESVARRTLQLDQPAGLDFVHRSDLTSCQYGSGCWLSQLTRPDRKVVFAYTDAAGKDAAETLTSGKNITNHFEAIMCVQTLLALTSQGVAPKDIGIITLYRSQLTLLRRLVKAAGVGSEVEIDSADRFQGRDKECILLSMVRSNDSGTVGDLLKDARRINVALTRARSKLVMFGNRKTLRDNSLLADLLALIDERGWGFDLPARADQVHDFGVNVPFSGTVMEPAADIAHASPRRTPTRQPLVPLCGADVNARVPNKSIQGQKVRNEKSRRAQEQIAVEIWEDMFDDDGGVDVF